MQILSGLRRWRRHRAAHAPREGSSLGREPSSLERGTALALVELSREIGTEGWESAIRRIVKLDSELAEIERVSFWSFHEATASIHCEAGYVASFHTFEHGATLCESQLPEYFAAMRAERVINMSDVKTDPRCRGLREYCSARGITSMLDVPVWVEGLLAGVLCHEHVGPLRRWSAREEDFVTCVSQIVSSAVGARDHGKASAAATRTAFLDTLSCVLSSLDSREIASQALALCIPRLGDMGVVWVQTGQGGLEVKAVKHVDAARNDLIATHVRQSAAKWSRDAPAIAGRVVRQAQSLLIPEFTPAVVERYGLASLDEDILLRAGARSAVSVPLVTRGKAFGALTLVAGGRRYDTGDLELVENIGSRVAAALTNARLYELARDAIRARDELLALAAHELRTPLTALQLTADHLLQQSRRAPDSPEAARSEKVALQVRRFSSLVEHILEAMRIRAEGVTLCRGPCDLANLVRDRVALVEHRAKATGGAIAVSCPDHVPIQCDHDRLATVLDALLDNALKFGRGGPIEVTLCVEGRCAILAVTDHGIGFSPDRLSAYFDPFERGVAKEQFGGLGLGLYVAKAIVDAHGGSISATSEPGAGATFVVRLPLGG